MKPYIWFVWHNYVFKFNLYILTEYHVFCFELDNICPSIEEVFAILDIKKNLSVAMPVFHHSYTRPLCGMLASPLQTISRMFYLRGLDLPLLLEEVSSEVVGNVEESYQQFSAYINKNLHVVMLILSLLILKISIVIEWLELLLFFFRLTELLNKYMGKRNRINLNIIKPKKIHIYGFISLLKAHKGTRSSYFSRYSI